MPVAASAESGHPMVLGGRFLSCSGQTFFQLPGERRPSRGQDASVASQHPQRLRLRFRPAKHNLLTLAAHDKTLKLPERDSKAVWIAHRWFDARLRNATAFFA